MTVIVYRDGVMASDSQLNYGHTKLGCKKIFRLNDGSVLGAAGESKRIMGLVRFLQGQLKRPPSMKSIQALRAHPDGRLDLYAETVVPEPLSCEYAAVGAGEDLAIGAMWMGASASKAVEAAIAHNNQCGGAVDQIQIRE